MSNVYRSPRSARLTPEGMTSTGGDNGSELSSSLRRDDFDVYYAQLATEFNSVAADAERRTARDRYARRTEEKGI